MSIFHSQHVAIFIQLHESSAMVFNNVARRLILGKLSQQEVGKEFTPFRIRQFEFLTIN